MSRATAQAPLRHPAEAVEARFARSQPVVSYRLAVDSADLTSWSVEIRIRNAPDTFRLAMATHPEYDDKYWRYVESLRVEAPGGGAAIAREDSALWRVRAPRGIAVVRYRVHPPAPAGGRRLAWKPFLAPTGGLVGGPQSFMYLVGAELAPAHLAVELPSSWDIATGLEPTSDPRTFFAPDVDVLLESPLLIGHFRSWRFAVDGVPHRVAYLPLPGAAPFDTLAFVAGIEKIVQQAVALFGRPAWREYTFILEDGAFGALEHFNSVILGAPSAELRDGLTAFFAQTAHEFFHTWNLLRIRPAGFGRLTYRTQPPVSGLWWSEGVTMFYADLLLRRAHLPVFDSTRTAHLAGLMARYLADPGNSRFSAERVSRATNTPSPGALGDYSASTHLQGELLGTMLDLVVRDATGGRRSLDDVMHAMFERFGGMREFGGRDLERTVASVCRCDVAPFFAAYVRNAGSINFNRYLRLIGLRAEVTSVRAADGAGRPAPDRRIGSWEPGNGRAPTVSLLIDNPASAWGRAGLHTGDRLRAVNGAAVATAAEFRALRDRIQVGDTVKIEVVRRAGPVQFRVVVGGYEMPSIGIAELPLASVRAQAHRANWVAGLP